MKSEILVIAEAILANTQVLKMLVEKLPAADRAEVAAHVEKAVPTMTTQVATVPVAAAPVTVPVVVPAPVVAKAPPTPAPAPVAPPAAPATPAPTAGACPIVDGKSLMDYVMAAYKSLGAEKGAKIQEVLNSIGCQAINEVRPDQYAALYAGIEGLKA